MKLEEYKAKAVAGLYLFDHFEAPDGSFIQRHANGGLFVYQAADGTRKDFYTVEALKEHLG